MINKEDLIYSAGVIDCDGHIIVRYFKAKDRYSIAAGVTNTRRKLLDFFKNKFGGSICIRESKNPKHKTRYDWYISEKSAFAFIEAIMPYLKIKKDQAKTAIEFKNLVGTQGLKQSTENQQKRIQLYSKSRILNARGGSNYALQQFA